MIINGEKYACEACVRGHRVSNCQHHDRPLQHINKKGRPVSQCAHCRAMRKSRSAHVRCDCGEKTTKCVHLRPPLEGHKESCCCNHGGRCTCAGKKDSPSQQLDPVPESGAEAVNASNSPSPTTSSSSSANGSNKSSSKPSSRPRRRASTMSSDGMLSFDANGHHKPTHRHNKAAQKCSPYQLNRVNSLPHGSLKHRSMDDLIGAADCPSRNSSGSGSDEQMQRRVRSEAASPLLDGSSGFSQMNGQLPPLDLSNIKYTPYIPNSADFFGSLSDYEQPLFSAGLSATSVDWNNYEGLDFNSKSTDFSPSSYSQPQSFGGFDFSGPDSIPTLTATASTSGEVSEVEDFLSNPLDDFDAFSTATGTTSGYSISTSQLGLLSSNPSELSSLEFDDFNFMKKASSKFMSATGPLDDPLLTGATAAAPNFSALAALDEDSTFWINDYSGLPLTDSPNDSSMPSFWDS